MPTIPLRDSPSTTPRKPFTRSPGRAYSMSRLDQLAKPRKRPSELPSVAESTNIPFRPLSRPQSSVSRSMSHLLVSKPAPTQRLVRKTDSNSMQHLATVPAPLPPPRTTRAAQLRQQKLAQAAPPVASPEGKSTPPLPANRSLFSTSVTSSLLLTVSLVAVSDG